ncbi:hypothetical protein JCGZ_03330 [Jatropha curcas]|uniref:TIR domain-containing protein n=1 Tax=Jatropha curcas TaxID=180498 RepID=A0A067JQ69_JATCU|nr:hypothetical protein JCGZ_03330 [Jatropha curcas]
MASCSSSSNSSLRVEEKYEVFLSFTGSEDSCINFTSHLYTVLSQKQLKTFMADSLNRGDELWLAVTEVIEESKLALIIFSKDYAPSSLCLDLLVKILDCKRGKGLIVLPVFNHVDPLDVGKLSGDFGEAIFNLEEQFKEEMNRVYGWRAALEKVAYLSGWVFLATRQ